MLDSRVVNDTTLENEVLGGETLLGCEVQFHM